MNKQIEEMTNVIFESSPLPSVWRSDATNFAEALYNAGYRKAFDVVAEVLADVMFAISKIVSEHIESDNSLTEAEVDIIHALAELKKKYTEEGK